jgi:IS1 family transposase
MKQAHSPRFTERTKIGDQWTFVAIDPDTKLVPAYRVGKRTRETAVAFMADLSERLSNRVQISSDALTTYVDAVERAFGADVD